MSYSLTPRPQNTVELTARLDAEQVARERQAIAVAFRRSARVAGFRPGKAPLALVQARFAADIREELDEALSKAVWREVVEKEPDFRPLTTPEVASRGLDEDGSFHYAATVEVRPRYQLPPVEGLTLPETSLEVPQAEVDAELERLRRDHSSWEPADDQAAATGHLVEAEVREELEGEVAREPTSARFILGEDDLPEEIVAALAGARVGDERVAERTFAEDHPDARLAGKQIRHRVTVSGLKSRVLPEMSDDLARTVGFDTLEALTERVREGLAAAKRADRRRTWHRALLDQLEVGLDVNELPPTLVAAALREDLTRFASSMMMQGVDPQSADVNWRELSVRIEPAVRRRVLDDLVLEQLAEEWQVPVAEETVASVIRDQAARLHLPPAEHRANLEKEGRLGELRHAVRMAATVGELIRRAGGGDEP